MLPAHEFELDLVLQPLPTNMILPDATCAFRLFGLDLALRDILLLLVATTTVYWCVQCVARHFRRQEIPHPLPMDFADLGFRMIGCKTRGTAKSQARRFETHFGVDHHLAAELWRDLEGSGWLRYAGLRPNPEHLLYALIFLRQYCVEEIHATHCNTNVRTFRKWAWFYAEGIANLDAKYVSHFLFAGRPCMTQPLIQSYCCLSNRYDGKTAFEATQERAASSPSMELT